MIRRGYVKLLYILNRCFPSLPSLGHEYDAGLAEDIGAFCRVLVQTPQLREEVEQLVALLISYGTAKAAEDERTTREL